MGAEVKTTVLALHVHNWLIESPGPGKHILMGTCRGCGVTRGFTGGINEKEMDQFHMETVRKVKRQVGARVKDAEAT